MNKDEAHIVLTKMKFKYSHDKDIFYKNIVPSGDARGDKYTLFARHKDEKIEMWLNPRNDLIYSSLGEVKAIRAITEGRLDPKTWNPEEIITIKNPQGGNEIIELTPAPEDLEKESKEEKSKEKGKKENKINIVEKIKSIVGNDVLEIFGDTGTGKSRMVLEIANLASKDGKRVVYYDTEGNLSPDKVRVVKNMEYIYNPSFDSLRQFAENPPACDVLIIDSIGFPVLTKFAKMDLKRRGEALLSMIAILGDLKVWAWKNKAIAIVVNQPISEMGIKEGDLRRPFGDKSSFAAKEVWEAEKVDSTPNFTKILVKSFRSRDMGYGTIICEVVISNKGVEIKWRI